MPITHLELLALNLNFVGKEDTLLNSKDDITIVFHPFLVPLHTDIRKYRVLLCAIYKYIYLS